MKNKILLYLLGGVFAVLSGFLGLGLNYANAYCYDDGQCFNDDIEPAVVTAEKCPGGCCGIKLNTNFPIIGNCIKTKGENTNPTNAFPTMMGALTKIVMSVILVVCFIMIIVAGIYWAADNPKEAKPILTRVARTVILLGLSGVILKLVNPNFFG